MFVKSDRMDIFQWPRCVFTTENRAFRKHFPAENTFDNVLTKKKHSVSIDVIINGVTYSKCVNRKENKKTESLKAAQELQRAGGTVWTKERCQCGLWLAALKHKKRQHRGSWERQKKTSLPWQPGHSALYLDLYLCCMQFILIYFSCWVLLYYYLFIYSLHSQGWELDS